VAITVWTALLVLAVAFVAVAFATRERGTANASATSLLFWVAIAGSVFVVALSRWLPSRLGTASTSRDAVTFTRLLVAWALCEAAALLPLVAFIITGDARLLGVFAVDLVALVLLYPSDPCWESLAPEAARARAEPPRRVR
jgi:hypothetical protein